MKKKLYIQPSSAQTQMLTGNVLNLTSTTVDNTTTDGMRDEAPMRKISVLYI